MRQRLKNMTRFALLFFIVIPFTSVLFVNCSQNGFQNTLSGASDSSSLGNGGGNDGGGTPGGPISTLPTTTTTSSTTTTMPSGGGGGSVSSTHPRLWLSDATNFARLKAAASANSAQWTSLKSFCDSAGTSIPQGNAYQGDLQLKYIASFALCYQVTGNATYAQKALTLLTTNDCPSMTAPTFGCSPLYFNKYVTDSGYGARNYVPALALAYDWLYNYMNTSVSVSDLSAKTLGGALIQRMNAWLTWYASNGYCRTGDSNCMNFPAPHTGVSIANYYSGYFIAQVAAAIAVGGDDSSGASLLSTANSMFTNVVGDMDTYLPEGHHPEGSYGSATYERYVMGATALRWSTGDTGYLNSQWFRNYPFFKLNAVSNDGKFYLDDGTWHWDAFATTNDAVMAGYAFGWNSNIGQTVMTYINIAGGSSTVASGNDAWKNFMFYDPTASPISLTNTARSYVAKTYGMSLMRSDWTAASGTWASFAAARWIDTEGEEYPDAGQVEIYKSNPLLINGGFGDRWGQSQQESGPYYNTLTFENRTDGGPNGQIWFQTANCPNPAGNNPIGIKKFNDSGDSVFTSAELSPAYAKYNSCSASALPADFVVRNHLYIRPGLFFVYDQIALKNGVPTEHFHFPTNPSANGASQWTVTNGTGVLHVAAVSPSVNATIASQAANSLKYSDGSTGPQVSNYHLSMTAKSQTSYQSFLTFFHASLSSVSSSFPTVQAIQPSSGQGVRVSGLPTSETATPVVVIFADSTKNTPMTAVQYTVTSGSGTIHYVALLQPNMVYQVTKTISGGQTTISVSPSTSGNVTSDAAGVLRFIE